MAFYAPNIGLTVIILVLYSSHSKYRHKKARCVSNGLITLFSEKLGACHGQLQASPSRSLICINRRFINTKNSPYDPQGCGKCLKLLGTILAYHMVWQHATHVLSISHIRVGISTTLLSCPFNTQIPDVKKPVALATGSSLSFQRN